ncbi:hypothetical protein CEXT_292731 [Caerostris extrusa]|uniref:Uncharacterized protein n=1 Tax=Caerostris extrusa TaxID=172846 RepID=A0AAV4WQW2_CAEEX|nr:hypothetical protein CEXT_292731 [Caerostris extrusa]
MNLGAITTNHKANDKNSNGNILAPHQRGINGKQYCNTLEGIERSELFSLDSEVTSNVRNWLQSQPNSFYERGIHRLVQPWDKCLCNVGD